MAKPDVRQLPSGDVIRVLIIDDHALVRTGLKFFLAAFDDLELIGEGTNGHEAIQLCTELEPDVVLMDLLMPGMDGTTAIRTIRSQWPQVQVIALTNFQEAELVQEALQAGAIGYLLKNVSADELARAIRTAYAGQSTLAPEATLALIEAAAQPRAPGHDLTDREREVLALMVEGLSNREIGERLTISPLTAKFHVSNILSKLEVSSRTEAVALAVHHRLIS
jgi:NarL family two-component system response regulator LiaR